MQSSPGALAGTVIGVLPGLGPTAGIALILPISYSFEPATGLIMMAGMYYGAMYGGSTTAILLNMPGEAGSVMTCVDGYKLTQKGRAGAALTIVALASFIGGTVATLGVMLFAPTLASCLASSSDRPSSLRSLPAGLILFSRISGGTLAAGIFPMAHWPGAEHHRPGSGHGTKPLHVRVPRSHAGHRAGCSGGRRLWHR